VCPVKALIPYLIARGNRPGLLFMLPNGKMLTRKEFSAALDRVLIELKLNPKFITRTASELGQPPQQNKLE